MKALLIHLSDIHINENKSNPILERVNKIVDAALSVSMQPDVIFVVVTGDIAFSGKPSEYNLAEDLFSGLKKEFESRKVCQTHLIFVPGNHDCNFDLSDQVRELILSNISIDKCDASVSEQVVKVQKDYFDFCQKMTGRVYQNETKIFSQVIIDTENQIIQFNLLNSAWMSSKREQQGKLSYPIQFIQPKSEAENVATVSITLFHHPYAWFESSNGRMLRGEIEKISDIILTGHEHDDGFYKKTNSDGSSTEYLEGDVLQETGVENLSGFNLIILNTEDKQQEIFHFNWNEQGYFKQDGESVVSSFLRNINRLRNEFVLDERFENCLHDPGAQYSHPYKENIQLEDIFIYPDLKRIRFIGNKNGHSDIIQRPIQNFFIVNDHVSLIGQEKSGKTSLAKMLFLDYYSKGYIPLLLNGSDIKSFDEKYVRSLLDKSYSEEYLQPAPERFRQLSFETKVIIIDDFDKTRLNSKGRDKIIELLKLAFKKVILIGGDNIRIKDLLTLEKEHSKLLDFIECTILEFGYLRRSELIEKWYSLSQEFYVEVDAINKKVIGTERIITSLLGKNFIPSYPIFILALIQQQDIQTPVKPSTTTGSYGFIYESLLTAALLKSSKLIVDLDTQYSYLSELAYYIFTIHKKTISSDQAYDWHQRYCSEYSTRLDVSEMQDYFINASILIKENDRISFRYSYMYYYFVGRFFRDHIGEELIRNHILKMSNRLYQAEPANILLFLCYLSKDPYILTTIISASKNLFSTEGEFNIITDTNFLYQSAENLPKVILSANDPKENRRALLDRRDRLPSEDQEEDNENEESDDESDDESLNKVLQISAALKTVHIIGQILRNFHGSLKGKQKLELAQECYSLGMRILKFIFTIVEDNTEELLDTISEALKNANNKLSPEQINEEARKIMFLLMEGITFSIIRHVSDSLGHEKLALTFDEIIKNNNHISYRFIDISVRLDYFFNNFPETEVNDLNKDISNKVFPHSLLKRLVWYHFYIYPSDFRIRDSICKKLGIELRLPQIFDDRVKKMK